MSRLQRLIKSLTSPVAKSDRSKPAQNTAGDARRRYEYKRTREGKGGNVEKQAINRRAESYSSVQEAVVDRGGMRKPYDPLFLRDISTNAVVQAYIDTLAQDAATANWRIEPRDDHGKVSDPQINAWESDLKDIHPELPFRDVIEATARILLELGDATWVKHYYENTNNLAEALVVDSSTMFKRVNEHGIVDGYIQASRRSQQVKTEFTDGEVVWFSWSVRPDRYYGQGPLEKAQSEVELLEELAEKERLDLVAGSQPGVISPDYNDEFGGTVPAEDWDNFVEGMQLDEGERHRVGYSKIPVEFEPITPNYQELQVLSRSKYWVTVVGSVFKVNPSYAGFDFENVNRATDESQQQAYAQRGFRVLLRQLEESINDGLIHPEFSEDVRFRFKREQTVEERETRANLIQSQADAGQDMASALEDSEAEVRYRDGELVVDDGVITPSDDGGGEGGGLFGSVDTPSTVGKDIRDAVLEEVETDRFVPPEGAAESCRRALELIDEHGRDVASGGTEEALGRARQIIEHYENDEPLVGTNDEGVPYVTEIANFFARHRAQDNHEYDEDEYEARYADPGWLADMLWGGDEGFRWSTSLDERIEEVESELSDGGKSVDRSKNDDGVFASMSKDDFVAFEKAILDAHRTQIQPASVDDIEKRAWTRDDAVPDYVQDAISNVIDRGAIFERFESIPNTLRDKFEGVLSDNLTQPQGWSLDSIVDDLQDAFPGTDEDDLETIARTETTSVLNQAREEGYESRDDADRYVYYWQGPGDSRTTDLCEDLKIATGQESGSVEANISEVPGEPVDMSTLVRLEREISDYHFPDLSFRKHVPHINCRHTFVRDAASDVDIDVDVPDAEVFNSASDVAHDHTHDEPYADVVGRVAKYVSARTRREREIERACGESIVQVLRRAFDEADGRVEPAKRKINERLRESPNYDHESNGLMSKKTLYSYRDKYEDRIGDVI